MSALAAFLTNSEGVSNAVAFKELWRKHPKRKPQVVITNDNATSRFWKHVDKECANGCWEWRGYVENTGYGRIRSEGRLVLSHRYSFAIHNGGCCDATDLLHKCDNPLCVNPEHLYAGTPGDNMRDRTERRRTHSRLTPENVQQIRQSAESTLILSKRFGVSQSMIVSIKNKTRWKWVP